MRLRTEEFDYLLPKELIAQHAEGERSSSRLLVLNRSEKRTNHRCFRDITAYLHEGDALVLNNTKVIRARLSAKKRTGGKVEILLVEKIDTNRWACITSGVRKDGGPVEVEVEGIAVRLVPGMPFWTVHFPEDQDPANVMARYGKMPLPHYIRRGNNGCGAEDFDRYQTVYARFEGSIAAPTAGLHFDEGLLKRIEEMGVRIVTLTLHVGVGTFFLIKSDYVEGHEMHEEAYSVPADSLRAVKEAKGKGGRVIAVGTSAVRTLETACAGGNGNALSGRTGLFIYPGYRFRMVDALITNFHLPRSTPLMLVSAFAGKEMIQMAYREAIEQGYKFYSYGDAMFIS